MAYSLAERAEASYRLELMLFLVILPAIFANAAGFGASREQLIGLAEQGSVASRILYVGLFVVAVVLIKVQRSPLLWSKGAFLLAGYLMVGLIYTDYPGSLLRGLFVALTSLLLWNVFGHSLASLGQEALRVQVDRLPVLVLFWGILETALWWLTPARLEYGFMGDYIGYFLQPNLLAKLICLGLITQLFKIRIARRRLQDIFIFLADTLNRILKMKPVTSAII